MTAINVFLRPEAAYIVSDGLAVHQGNRVSFGKVVTLPHLRAAVAHSGNAIFGFAVAGQISILKHTLPDAASSFAEYVHDIRKQSLSLMGAARDIRAALVGWPEGGAHPEGIAVAVDDEGVTGPMPFSAFSSPELPDHVSFDGPGSAVDIIAAQRATYPNDVGGFVELTTITRDRIVSEILHRWPEDFTKEPA